MQIGILGPLEVRHDGRAVDVSGARLCALLVRLALDAGRPVSVRRLVEALWPEQPPADEVNALQSLVSRLRRVLGDPRLVRQSDAGYCLAVAAEDVDAGCFEQLAGTGRRQLRAADPVAAAATLRRATALWRGALPAGVDPAAAARLEDQRVEALTDRIEADLQLDRHGDLVGELEALTAAYPLREGFVGQLMVALAGSGRQAEALAVYERVRRQLADELGVDPSTELREQQLAVLRGSVGGSLPSARPSITDGRSNLRAPLTSFLGREDDVARVGTLLDRGRLVTVLGPGGAGKTRLATEAAARRVDSAPDGVWFVELAPVTDPAEVAHTVLAALGHRERARLDRSPPREPREVLDRLLDALAGRRCVLVVDNCEHVLDAVAGLVDVLLARSPQLRVLTTSREPLGIGGETLAPLAPLPTPRPDASLDEARSLAAVRLFEERAAAVRPDFCVDASTVDAVTEIVRRLDGLPLAIELAAARLRALPVSEIAARLSDRFRLLTGGSRTALPRHRTLRAVVDWSWDLLSPAERLLAERVAAFPAGVTPVTAAGVCADGPLAAEAIPDLLAALVDKSLLQLAGDDGPRYRMLETIREYGTDRLAERGELAAMRTAHARYFADLTVRAEPKLRGREQLHWLRLLESEHDNILAALRALCDDGNAAEATALALALSWFWTMSDRHAEAATWLGIVLDLPGEVERRFRVAAQAVHGLNSMAAMEIAGAAGDDPRGGIRAIADELVGLDDSAWPMLAVLKPLLLFVAGDLERSARLLDVAVTSRDPWVRATAHVFRARFAENAGNVGQIRADAEAAYAGYTELGDTWGLAWVLPLTAQLRVYDGDLDGARVALEQAQARVYELTASDMEPVIAVQRADVLFRLGDVRGAREVAASAVALAARRGGLEMSAVTLTVAGALERLAGDAAAARDLQRRAEEVLRDAPGHAFGVHHGVALVEASGALIDLTGGDVESAARRLAAAYRAGRQTADHPISGYVALATAELAAAVAQPAEAARLLGAAARLRGADDPTQPDVARVSSRVRAELGVAGYLAAWNEGWQLDIASALDSADPALLLLDAQVRRA